MSEYPKIKTIFKRDPETKYKTLLMGEWACPEFRYLQHNWWEFTEKVDGTNIRIVCYKSGWFAQDAPKAYEASCGKGGISFKGKTNKAQIPQYLLAALDALRPQLDTALPTVFAISNAESIVLYGEGYGAKIQKGGGNYRPDQGFVLFDVRIGDYWLKRKDVEDVAQTLGLDIVPIIGKGTLWNACEMAQQGFKSAWGDFQAEGIVARPSEQVLNAVGERIIAKIKCKDFSK